MAVTSAQIVSDAMQYAGHAGYTFGGVPGATGRTWDCSSFVNAVTGRDLHMAIPGYAAGKFNGDAHGPVVAQWASWAGAPPLPAGQRPSPGDIVVFNGIGASGHMGIATSANEMISALDTASGTLVTPIDGYGPVGAPLSFHRLTAAVMSGGDPGTATIASNPGEAAADMAAALIVGAAVPAVFAFVILGLAAVLGVGLAILGTTAAARAAGP